MSFKMPRIAVAGSLHYDIMLRTPYLPRQGETLIGSQWWWKPGGKGCNQAVAASRHGAAVEMIGALGTDDFGAKLRQHLEASGVGHRHVSQSAHGSGMSVAMVEPGGDYSAVVVSGANLAISVAQIEAAKELLSSVRVLILQNEIPESANAGAARIVQAAGGTVILNAAPARAFTDALNGSAGVLVVNAIEAEMLGASPVEDLATAVEAARRLRTIAPIVIVTAGGNGVAASAPGGDLRLPAHAVANPQTHGAGDVFVGALAARLAEGVALPEALAYANAAASLHVGASEAGQAGIGPEQVRAFLARQTAKR